jgi:hypothetical protein
VEKGRFLWAAGSQSRQTLPSRRRRSGFATDAPSDGKQSRPRVELLVDVLNALNDTAEERLATDDLYSSNFARPTAFGDPRRAMFGVRVNFGR